MLKEYSEGYKRYLLIGVRCAVIGIAATLIMMLIFAAIMLFLNLDRNLAVPFSTVSLGAGCFLSAFTASKSIGKKGYLIGASIGVGVFVILTIISLILGKNGLSYNTLFHFIIISLTSLSGGILGVNKKEKTKYI